MSNFIPAKNRLENVYFLYTKIKTPALEYEKSAHPDKDKAAYMYKEFVTDVLVTEDTYKELKKKYKTVQSIKSVREFTAEEFETTFKVAPPYEAETYYVLKFSKMAYYKNDEKPSDPPSVYGSVNKIKDRNGKPISIEVEIGNGSLGSLLFKEREWKFGGKAGLSLDLRAVLIKELVEYASSDAADDFDFDEDEDFDFEDDAADTEDSQADEPVESTPAEDVDDDEW